MAMAMGSVGPSAAASGGKGFAKGGKGRKTGGRSASRVVCSAASPAASYYTSGLAEQYRTLRVQPGASEKEVKKAFRQLALQVTFPFSRSSFSLPVSCSDCPI